MKNKILVVLLMLGAFALFPIEKLHSQINVGSWAQYVHVYSYSGATQPKAYTLQVGIQGNDIIDSNWSIAVRVKSDISNSTGKTMNPENISIRFNEVTGGLTLAGNQTIFKLSTGKQTILNSNTTLKRDKTYQFHFDIIVEGGSYLEQLIRDDAYNMKIIFSVSLNGNETLFETNPTNIGIQIHKNLTGTPPSPTYGIEVNSNARNGLLEFKTITDYVNGVSQTYQNGLSVTSHTGYAVQVRSLKTNFEAGTHTLPISAVSLEIKDPNNSAVGGTISLSGNDQTVFNATNSGTQPRLFNLRYFTQPNDERLMNAKPASYETTLVYTLAPQ